MILRPGGEQGRSGPISQATFHQLDECNRVIVSFREDGYVVLIYGIEERVIT